VVFADGWIDHRRGATIYGLRPYLRGVLKDPQKVDEVARRSLSRSPWCSIRRISP
jgi:hypothetical protein